MKNNRIRNKWAIRVSSTSEVGAGHFMRCLSLAKELVIRSNKVHFYKSLTNVVKRGSQNVDYEHHLIDQSCIMHKPISMIIKEVKKFFVGLGPCRRIIWVIIFCIYCSTSSGAIAPTSI